MNEGDIRVLIGSTGKMGVGMNAQKRITAIHHLDAPWRPGDIEQREGRGLRQGNINSDVAVYVYVTKKTFDSRMWDNLQRKAAFINQIMAGDLTAREAEGDGDFALSAAEIKAISSGNPLIIEQFEVATEVSRLEALERAHNKAVTEARNRVKELRSEIAADEGYLNKARADLKRRADTSGDRFIMNIGDRAVTERKAAGSEIIKAAKDYHRPAAETVKSVRIGRFAGFDLYVTTDGQAALKGAGIYRVTVNMDSPMGTIQAIEAAARKIDGIVSRLENRLAENKGAVPKFEAAAAAVFDKKDELMRLRLRAAEIAAELTPEENLDIGVEEEPEDSISRFIDKGGRRNGREADNSGDGRRNKKGNTGEQVAGSSGGRQSPERTGVKGGLAEGKSGTGLFDMDSEGRRISESTLKRLSGTAVAVDGHPIRVYHATDTEFKQFTKGDIGFHFGDKSQAQARAKDKGIDNPVYVDAYLSIKNPVVIDKDPMNWRANATALLLWDAGIITAEERAQVDSLWEFKAGYSHPASVKLRGILKSKGYDGIAYENGFEGGGTSYIAFDDSQIIRSPIDSVKNAYSNLTPRPEYWKTERVGEERKVKPIGEIIADIQHDFGLNITTGHIRGAGVRGQYDSETKGIRIKIVNDLPTAAHELGHALDHKYRLISGATREMTDELINGLDEGMKSSYKRKAWRSEGIAEFVRKFLQNRETAAIDYPEFTKYFINSMDGRDRVKIMKLADDINAYYSLGADTAADAIKLRSGKPYDPRTLKEKAEDKLNELYQKWVDRNHGIKLFDDAVGGDVYKLATNAAYADAVAGSIITGDLYDMNGYYMGTGLKAALEGIDLSNEEEYMALANT